MDIIYRQINYKAYQKNCKYKDLRRKNMLEEINKIENLLKNTKFATVATSSRNGIVSTAQMCIVNKGLTVYFQTDKTFEKIRNIRENNNIAFNIGAYNFKAKAKIIGKPSENKEFINLIKQKHFQTYKSYTLLENEVLIEAEITECKIWGINPKLNIHEQETIQILDFINNTKKVIICDKM